MHSNGVRSILTINTATIRNDGKYRCRATNVDGRSGVSNEAELISKLLYTVIRFYYATFYSFTRNYQ